MLLVRRDLELTSRAVGWQAAGINLRCPVTIVHKDLFSILIAASLWGFGWSNRQAACVTSFVTAQTKFS